MNKEKVIIVGNGSSIFEKEYGDKIDSFDLVCRMNRGYFEGRKGYEKNVGSRTDILIVHDGFMTEQYLSDKVFNSLQKILVGTPTFKWDTEVNRIKETYSDYLDKIEFIPKKCEDKLKNISDFGHGWPSTGLIGSMYILENYTDVTLIGFDGYDTKYDYGHYFSETDDRTTEFFHDKFKDGHHKLDAERNTWNFLRSYYKPGVLSE